MTEEKPQITNPQSDSRLKSFLRQAAAIIATEKGLNAESRIKLQTLADHVKLPPALFDEALNRLQTSFDAASNLTHYEKAFLKFLDSEFEKLTGGVLSPGMEKHAIEFAQQKFQINSTRAEQLIQIQAEATGIGRISYQDAERFADQSIADRVGELTELDEESKQELYRVGKKWGLSESQVDRIVHERLSANRSKTNPTWKKLLAAAVVGALLLGSAAGIGLTVGWIPDEWVSLLTREKTIATVPVDSPQTPANADSRFPQPIIDDLITLREVDSQLAQSVDKILGEDPTQRRLGYQNLVTRVCVNGYREQWSVANAVCQLFYNDPDESSADEIIATAQQYLSQSRSDELSVRDLKNSYQANQLLGQLYFTRYEPERESRQTTVANCVRTALNLSLDQDLTLDAYLRASELAIASDQWTRLIQLAWASPGHASVLVQPLLVLTRSKLDSVALNHYRDDALISIMETDRSRWPEMEEPIRDSVASCDEAKLIDWIFVFGASKHDETSDDDRLRNLLRQLLLPRIDVQPKSRLREDIDEAIINYGLAYRNRALRPVIDRNERLEKFVANTLEIETGDVASGVSPDRIAQLAVAVNIELAFCSAIENVTHIDDSSFAQFDRLISTPAPRLRELISLPIDRRDSNASGAASATASDKRRMTASLDRLSDLSPDSTGLRVLALNQLERVAHRFEGISYRDAEILATYFLTRHDLKEQVNVNKQIASFSHWPNLALAIADQIPDRDVTTDQALTLARLLLDRDFETGGNSDWKKVLHANMIAAVSDRVGNQIDLDPNNIKSNWVRLKIYLNECYRERLAIGLDQSYAAENILEPWHATSRLIEAIASRQSTAQRILDVERAIGLIRQIPSNEIEKTAFANQLLARVLIDDLADSSQYRQSQLLIAELEKAFLQHSLAGEHLHATELALLRIVDLKRSSLVNNLLQREAKLMEAPNRNHGWSNVRTRKGTPMISWGRQLIAALIFVFVGAGLNVSQADVIWVRGQSTRIYGQIVSMTDTHYEVRVFENGRFSKTIKIQRSTIEQAVSNISVKRLTQLDPSNATAYRDYAEELAAQKMDPSAQDLARRLYLMAAANSESTLRSSALLGLIAIADSEAQRQRLEVLRSLVDPDSAFSGNAGEHDSKLDSITTDQQRLMLELIHSIRKEKSDQAIKLLTPAANRKVFDLWSNQCSLEELDRMARVNRPSKPQLAKLLGIESRIISPETGPANSAGRKLDWGDFATQVSGILGAVPSFNNVTRFDPEKSVYREGQWVKP